MIDLQKKPAVAVSAAILAVLLLWHIIVAFTPELKLSGLFLAKPAKPGYQWFNANHADSRLFWQDTDVIWKAGVEHPDYNLESAETEGEWNLMPGYRFINKNKGLETIWTPGLLHPDYMAWSDDEDGQWIPVTGYKFVEVGDTFSDCIWDPNRNYPDLKIKTTETKDNYLPYPGYKFVEPNVSLNVVWVPGTINYEDPSLIADVTEGHWKYRGRGVYHSSDGDMIKKIVAGVIVYKALSSL